MKSFDGPRFGGDSIPETPSDSGESHKEEGVQMDSEIKTQDEKSRDVDLGSARQREEELSDLHSVMAEQVSPATDNSVREHTETIRSLGHDALHTLLRSKALFDTDQFRRELRGQGLGDNEVQERVTQRQEDIITSHDDDQLRNMLVERRITAHEGRQGNSSKTKHGAEGEPKARWMQEHAGKRLDEGGTTPEEVFTDLASMLSMAKDGPKDLDFGDRLNIVPSKDNPNIHELRVALLPVMRMEKKADGSYAVLDVDNLDVLRETSFEGLTEEQSADVAERTEQMMEKAAVEMREAEQIEQDARERAVEAGESSIEVRDLPSDIRETIIEHFAYQDAPGLPEAQIEDIREATLNLPNAERYAEALQTVMDAQEEKRVGDMAEYMVTQMKDVLEAFNMQPSAFGESKSWANWDLAKQSYYVQHPKESSSDYIIADPFSSVEKQNEIIDRHVGWEVYGAVQDGRGDNVLSAINKEGVDFPAIMELLGKTAKENMTLSSKDLAKLGNLLRSNLG